MGGSYAEISEEERAEGRAEGTLRSLRKMIMNLGLSLEQAMAALEVPEADRPAYQKQLGA